MALANELEHGEHIIRNRVIDTPHIDRIPSSVLASIVLSQQEISYPVRLAGVAIGSEVEETTQGESTRTPGVGGIWGNGSGFWLHSQPGCNSAPGITVQPELEYAPYASWMVPRRAYA